LNSWGSVQKDIGPIVRHRSEPALDAPFEGAAAALAEPTGRTDSLAGRTKVSSDAEDAVAAGAVVYEALFATLCLLVQIVQPYHYVKP
jgi:hypothetical protein